MGSKRIAVKVDNVLNFKSWIDKVQMDQITGKFTIIYPFFFFVNHLGYTLWISTPFLPLDRAPKVISVKQLLT